MSDKRSLIEVWFQRVWAEEDKSAIDEMMHDMGEAKGLGEKKIVGPTEFKEFHSAICALLFDIHITIQNYMEDGNWSCVYCRLEAKSKLEDRKIDIDGMVLVKIKDGKIVEGYNQFDFMSMWGATWITTSRHLCTRSSREENRITSACRRTFLPAARAKKPLMRGVRH